ncbi:MAG: 2-(1,2-epoxy-1,2-dihydrophenyl)acetyl-CoA isomerase [Deltaproteobacteria bacterium HGW-Deltaproteobacteria-9]|nr:MAG: 2-(1,2-epoxy-1,2-dihydrophenyl)acetyl-CoA isomerase [Deltaproteobacteria bacterium HGW-Deltaproteobacteria-9]
MDYQYTLFQVDKGIATITLNRPKEMNCINFGMVEEVADAVDRCEKDGQIRAVVVTGANQMFSAGDDIKMMELAATMSGPEVAQTIESKAYPVVMKRFMALPKPVIACVNGICFGAGGELALACDYVIASDQASFGQLYINLGLIGNTYLLPQAVGARKALELIWTGKIINAEEALRLGMINKVVPAASLEEETAKLAYRMAQGPTLAYGYAKKVLRGSLNMEMDEAIKLMTDAQGKLMKTNDHREGVQAFTQRRKPAFTGA